MGSRYKYSQSGKSKKTLYLSKDIDCFLENIAGEFKAYCATASQSDVVQALLESLKKDWANGKAKRQILSRIYSY